MSSKKLQFIENDDCIKDVIATTKPEINLNGNKTHLLVTPIVFWFKQPVKITTCGPWLTLSEIKDDDFNFLNSILKHLNPSVKLLDGATSTTLKAAGLISVHQLGLDRIEYHNSFFMDYNDYKWYPKISIRGYRINNLYRPEPKWRIIGLSRVWPGLLTKKSYLHCDYSDCI